MKIVNDYPPNIAKIEAALGPRRSPGVLFCYGDAIYSPGGLKELPPQIIAHESVHSERQAKMGGPDVWWDKYLSDPQFRYDEELIAHQAECAAFAMMNAANRPARRRYASDAAKRLSGPLYGRVACFGDALKALRVAAKLRNTEAVPL